MLNLMSLGMVVLSYLIGSIPFGMIIVRLTTGKDVRTIESGRTGGTNAMRAAGFWAGLATGVTDVLKGAVTVWIAKYIQPDNFWLHILAPIAAIIGHNYSIFLLRREENGQIRFHGGAGGAPCMGGAFGLWSPSLIILLPTLALTLYFVGYASVTTLSVAVLSIILFSYRAYIGASSWVYAGYGLIAFVILAWSLRPNIKRLIAGNERLVGFRARGRKSEKRKPN